MDQFQISIPDTKIDSIRRRIESYNFFPAPFDDDWQYGTNTQFLKQTRDYWLDEYDWRQAEKTLNRFSHFKAQLDGYDLHFAHVVGEAQGKRPLLLLHGWPGSFYEFWACVGPLAYPSKFGGSSKDAFDLVIPSLPGYGFSSPPKKPIGQCTAANLFDKLMTDNLGYKNYFVQGGDWGSIIASQLGYRHSKAKGGGCSAIHLNMMGMRPEKTIEDPTKDEIQWFSHMQKAMGLEGSYLKQQMTKPQTLALALMDSPMGQAAWILEKFHGWSDLKNNNLLDIYSYDQLLTNIMIYLVNDAFATSVWFYHGCKTEKADLIQHGERIEVPTGFAKFAGEKVFIPPPRSLCERLYNIVDWQEFPLGGHFAAMERPNEFVEAIRKWGACL